MAKPATPNWLAACVAAAPPKRKPPAILSNDSPAACAAPAGHRVSRRLDRGVRPLVHRRARVADRRRECGVNDSNSRDPRAIVHALDVLNLARGARRDERRDLGHAAAGVGSTVTLSLGGKLDMPAIGLKGQPRTVTGRVRRLCDGVYRNLGPMARGEMNSMGLTGVLEVQGIEIVVISNHVEPHDLAAFTAVGIAPERKKFLMLKSRVHWRAGLKRLAYAVVECAGTGVCTSDYAALGLHKVRRPIYPIDAL